VELEKIGFYTLTDERALRVARQGIAAPLWRCELILTGRCNFRCPYCRGVSGEDIPYHKAAETVCRWKENGLFAIRFSGGEPMLYPKLLKLVELAKGLGIERIALSTNGSFPLQEYEDLVRAGVNDLSISLDACCAEDGDRIAGGVKGSWEQVVSNIRALAGIVYLTVGVVLTQHNRSQTRGIIALAARLGVSDIRVIPAAQEGTVLPAPGVGREILGRLPVLAYRLRNIQQGIPVRGIGPKDCGKCSLVLDDMAAMGGKHYPCIIYLREGGAAIGEMGTGMREERMQWFEGHNSHKDPICFGNCLDVCVAYNNKVERNRAEELAAVEELDGRLQ